MWHEAIAAPRLSEHHDLDGDMEAEKNEGQGHRVFFRPCLPRAKMQIRLRSCPWGTEGGQDASKKEAGSQDRLPAVHQSFNITIPKSRKGMLTVKMLFLVFVRSFIWTPPRPLTP